MLFCLNLGIFSHPAIPAESHHTEERLTEDAPRHLAGAFAAVYEDHAYLLDLKADLIGCIFHLNLEAIALKTYFIQLDGLQHATLVAHETRCGVVNQEASHDSDIFRGEIAHQHAPDRPVHHIHTRHHD